MNAGRGMANAKKKSTEKKTSSGNVKSGKSSDKRKEADGNER